MVLFDLVDDFFNMELKALTHSKSEVLLVCGLGVVTEEEDDWNYNEGICGTLGVEIPITKTHITSFEFNFNSWYAESKENGDTKYQPGIAFIFNLYFLSNESKLRPSISLGYIDWFLKDYYHGYGLGIGLTYELNSVSSVSIIFTFITEYEFSSLYNRYLLILASI